MLTLIWNTVLYNPLHNTLAFLVDIIPGGDVGIAVILLTIIVKLILFPLSQKALKSQAAMRELAPELALIKEKYGDNKEEHARQTFALYKKYNISPVSGCLPVLIQIPIIYALYRVFMKGISFTAESLYPFIPVPAMVSVSFLGILDLTSHSIILAIITGVSQFIQAYFAVSALPPPISKPGKKSFQEELARSMQIQTKYVLPIFIGVVAYQVSAAVALYWCTNNIFTIFQELYVRNKALKHKLNLVPNK
jgi:YidC/Oxa1 family membrane protein insertase